jgi:hypothetical protein
LLLHLHFFQEPTLSFDQYQPRPPPSGPFFSTHAYALATFSSVENSHSSDANYGNRKKTSLIFNFRK